MSPWIDFKSLREQLDFATVLRGYGVEIKSHSQQYHGFCPLPTHQGRKNSPSFSANLSKGIWHCFGCGCKGTVLDFALRMEGFDPQDRSALRQTALLLQARFGETCLPILPNPKLTDEKRKPHSQARVIINAPLRRELDTLMDHHPYLPNRGFESTTIQHFGLKYCHQGILKGRIAIPLHDSSGRLIGYSGRLVGDEALNEKNPKYRFPSSREWNGTIYQFKKSLFLYNGHRIRQPVSDLIVVEGFPGVWWLWQAGFVNTVGLMGSSCSPEQAALIVDLVAPDGRVWVFPDGDEAGGRCAISVLGQVARRRLTRWLVADPGTQPTDYSPDELQTMFAMEVINDGEQI